MALLNLAVEIAALPVSQPPARFRLNVASPVGEASADLLSPFAAAEIEEILSILNHEQQSSRQRQAQTARDVGERLFRFLFQTDERLSAIYVATLARAGEDGLRIRLNVENAAELSALPWETLRDPQRDVLALSRATPVVRYTPQLSLRRLPTLTYPIRVLVATASPSGFPPLDVDDEWSRLQAATADLQAQGIIELERLEHASLIALQRRLRAKDYHIFHFIGHSDYDAANQQGVLAFEDDSEPQKADVITGIALGREIGEETTIRLAILNSCHSARKPDRDPLTGIASGLVARGIPAVVAMQFNISDRAAKTFAEEYYRAIADNLPLDTALSEARRAIANRVSGAEWATPVLYMRSEDSALFNAVRPVTSAPMTPQSAPVSLSQTGNKPRSGRSGMWISAGIIGASVLLAALALITASLFNREPISPTPTFTAVEPTTPPALPDLQVGNIRISPRNPAPGEIFRLSVTITNVGGTDSGPFNYAWDASLDSPVLLNSFSDRVDNIPPGASKNISFPFSYGWWGSYNSQVVVDVDSEVRESNERNNRRPFEIVLENSPFNIDFSLLPTNEFVEPPFAITSDTYALWNLIFELIPDETCDTAALVLEEQNEDIFMQPASDSACPNSPLAVTVLRAPVSSAVVELLPLTDGVATLTLFLDQEGTQPVFTADNVPLTAGQPVQIGPEDGISRQIQRVEIITGDQPIRLTQVILFPPDDS